VKSSKAQTHAKFHRLPILRFEESQRLTSYAGLVVFQAFFQRIDLKSRLRACFAHMQVHPIFGHATVTMLLVVHLLLGFRRLRGLDYYRHDPLVARMIGLRRLPDVATVSRALADLHAQSVENVRVLVRTLVLDRLVRESFARLTLDFDGSVLSTKGHAEGTAVGFNKLKKGARSYYPLFCTVAQTGQFFDRLHRAGNVHDSRGSLEFMSECFQILRRELAPTILEARIDSAFFDEDRMEALDKDDVEFTCSVPFERFPELKRLIESERGWEQIDRDWAFAESSWHPKCWSAEFRFLLLRQRRPQQVKGALQLDLFEPRSFEFEYKVIVTNKHGSARSVLLLYNGRASQEKIFGEAKQHAALDVIPTRTLCGNQLFTLAAMLTHNLTRELQMQAAPRLHFALPKRPAQWEFLQLGTIRQRWLHLAGRLTRPAGRLTLTITENPVIREDLERFLDVLKPAA
jgi:hypothetical protein